MYSEQIVLIGVEVYANLYALEKVVFDGVTARSEVYTECCNADLNVSLHSFDKTHLDL